MLTRQGRVFRRRDRILLSRESEEQFITEYGLGHLVSQVKRSNYDCFVDSFYNIIVWYSNNEVEVNGAPNYGAIPNHNNGANNYYRYKMTWDGMIYKCDNQRGYSVLLDNEADQFKRNVMYIRGRERNENETEYVPRPIEELVNIAML